MILYFCAMKNRWMKGLFPLAMVAFFIVGLFAGCRGSRAVDNEVRKLAGKMLMVGFRGIEVNDSSLIIQQIKSLNLGGVILFDYDVPSHSRPRNIVSIEQVRRLTTALQLASENTLLIAVDEEGGQISRFKPGYGFHKSVTAQYLGAVNREDTTLFWSGVTADKLVVSGCNVNFAPDVDVNVNPECPVIGKLERSFSHDEGIVSQQAKWWIAGHHQKGILCAVKHFPGHGSAQTDSHKGFTDVTSGWSEKELIPFQQLINWGLCDMVMTAHVFNAKLDVLWPATLSDSVVTGLLRNKLGFNGVVVSDDMHMGAIENNYSLEIAVERALYAGIDLLVFSNNGKTYNAHCPEKVVEVICKLVEEGKVSIERLQQSVDRIELMLQKVDK